MLSNTTIWIIAAILLTIGHGIVIVHILLTKHEEPVSAVAWIMAIILSPVVGVLVYLLFGINRLHKMGRKIRLSADLFESVVDKAEIRRFVRDMESFTVKSTHNDENLPEFRKTLDNIFSKATVTDGNAIKLLKDGSMAYPEMYAAIETAVHSIHLQSYIIMNDTVGQKMFELLAKKAEAGVRVKVIYDGIGSIKLILSNFFMRYTRRHPNLQIRAFSKVNIFIPWRIQLRNHRKLLVVDGHVAFIGGINISAGNIDKGVPKRCEIHDLHCRINGPAVTELQKNFLRDWAFMTKRDLKSIIHAEDFQEPIACGNNRIRIIDSGPGQNYRATEKIFLTAAATARKTIIIMTPYFVPNHNFVSALSMAAARGVKITIIVPKKNDNMVVSAASHSIYKQLMSAGINIYEKQGVFSHIKAMLVDEQWASMGSSNCDVRSFKLNYELDFCVETGDFITILGHQLNEELEQSEQMTLKAEERKAILIRLFENICSLFTPIL